MDLSSASAVRTTAPEQRTVLTHYEHVAPLIAANFPNVPLVFTYYPDGLGTKPTFSNNDETVPHTVPRVPVMTSSGSHTYPGCAINTILYYIHMGAVGVHSWTPAPRDPDAVGFARILLKPVVGATQTQLRDALLVLRSSLQARDLDAIPLFEGRDAALYITFADEPAYQPVRAWLKDMRAHAIAEHPQLLVPNAKPHEQRTDARIEAPSQRTRPACTAAYPTRSPATPIFPWQPRSTGRK